MFERFNHFIASKEERSIFLLRGYAGTGKTSIVATLVKTLPLFNYKFVLLAPTGRAAKVISQYAKRTAFTIHKKIYKAKSNKDLTGPVFKLTKNYHSRTIFIVDEASMISSGSGSNDILNDLLSYVFEKEGNKVMFVGDIAQLPPVGEDRSLALNEDYYRDRLGAEVHVSTLTDITRQALDSGILNNATSIRETLNQKEISVKLRTKAFPDIFKMTSERLEDGLRYAYDKFGTEKSLVICRSNRSAVMYNHFIRNQLFYKEGELDAGDLLLIARNNYRFASDKVPSGFLANGDFIEVLKINRTEEVHGLRFADIQFRLVDYEGSEPIEAKIILDTLHTYTPALGQEENQKLYQSVLEDYVDLTKAKQKEAMKEDKYLNALQVKYAYALTCHKSQGGQWDAVFVDQGYIGEEQVSQDFVKWVYTAVTRAKKELFLVNFDKKFY